MATQRSRAETLAYAKTLSNYPGNRVRPQKNILECVHEWAFYTVRIWQEKIRTPYHIGVSGHLENSFSYKLSGHGEDENIRVMFQFLYYGKFVDMGVGRGTDISQVKENRTSRMLQGKMLGNRRVAKKWYSKTLFAETATLKEILAREYAHNGVIRVVEAFHDVSITL
ncbi:MAG: hypothetical protein NT040_11250 [Bacteroidetes bacterium]|nr:hypothetical protein [Bacteroidota bacterium]